jgi:2-methylcitrate dehydratase PrpD
LAARGALPATATPDSIAAITIETHPFARMLINRAPATTLAGKFSLPHVVAVAMATGEAGAEAFGAAMLDDPRVVRLRACVDIKPYEPVPPPPDDRPARVTVTLRDGQRITRECRSAQGGSDRPFPASVIDDKIAAMIAPAYPRFSEAFAAVARLEPRALAQGWSGFVAGFAS